MLFHSTFNGTSAFSEHRGIRRNVNRTKGYAPIFWKMMMILGQKLDIQIFKKLEVKYR
jgi:hypothetical protein